MATVHLFNHTLQQQCTLPTDNIIAAYEQMRILETMSCWHFSTDHISDNEGQVWNAWNAQTTRLNQHKFYNLTKWLKEYRAAL
jgi:hypothetical protein